MNRWLAVRRLPSPELKTGPVKLVDRTGNHCTTEALNFMLVNYLEFKVNLLRICLFC